MVALSLATDLARGQPMEHELRTCLLAVRLGELLGLDEDRLSDVYYVALLRWIGCTGHAHELSVWFGDEIATHHVQHIYRKIGVSTRAAATLFAMQHDLLDTAGAAEK